MQAYPHHYRAKAVAAAGSAVTLQSQGLENLNSDAPAEFGGPGDQWSPETLLIAAIADCFVLTFKAIARASKIEWLDLQCEVEGVLERVEQVTRFTRFDIHATLKIASGVDEHKARHILEKSEAVCLITNSLIGEKRLRTDVIVS
jgi:organic hydroperoxide reductase OsmC/OhrA